MSPEDGLRSRTNWPGNRPKFGGGSVNEFGAEMRKGISGGESGPGTNEVGDGNLEVSKWSI
jgi:hypothetical protein